MRAGLWVVLDAHVRDAERVGELREVGHRNGDAALMPDPAQLLKPDQAECVVDEHDHQQVEPFA